MGWDLWLQVGTVHHRMTTSTTTFHCPTLLVLLIARSKGSKHFWHTHSNGVSVGSCFRILGRLMDIKHSTAQAATRLHSTMDGREGRRMQGECLEDSERRDMELWNRSSSSRGHRLHNRV